eukprot:365226-Chlamydomonas_euryale.AAC.16
MSCFPGGKGGQGGASLIPPRLGSLRLRRHGESEHDLDLSEAPAGPAALCRRAARAGVRQTESGEARTHVTESGEARAHGQRVERLGRMGQRRVERLGRMGQRGVEQAREMTRWRNVTERNKPDTLSLVGWQERALGPGPPETERETGERERISERLSD